MIQVSVMYPSGSQTRFDLGYYLQRHMPMVRERWSSFGLHEAKVVKGVGTPDGGEPQFQVMAFLIWDSADAFKKAVDAHGDEIFGDIPNFTDTQPSVQINEFPE